MSYTLPSDVDDRPIAIDGAGTLGRRIASYAAGGTDVRIFDVSDRRPRVPPLLRRRHRPPVRSAGAPGRAAER
jgi:3-hydroxyacyl-CoA dehydrogenase